MDPEPSPLRWSDIVPGLIGGNGKSSMSLWLLRHVYRAYPQTLAQTKEKASATMSAHMKSWKQ